MNENIRKETRFDSMKLMTEEECRDLVPGAFLSFVRSDDATLYIVSEWKICRFDHIAREKTSGYIRGFIWDFGIPLLDRAFLASWNEQQQLNAKKSK